MYIINRLRLFAAFLVFFFLVLPVLGQDPELDEDVRVNQQFWIDYNFTKSNKTTRDLSTQIGFRKISPRVYDRFLAISTGNFEIKSENKWISLLNSYHLGTGVIYTSNYDANDNLELRLIQGIKYNFKTLKLLTFNNYIRFEQRFQTSFDDELTFGLRLRYRLSTELAWEKHLFVLTQGLYFPLEAEIFFNLTKADRFNDLLRLSPGVGYKLESGWRFETYLIFNRTKNITQTNNNSSDFILRIRIRDERRKAVRNSVLEEISDEEEKLEPDKE